MKTLTELRSMAIDALSKNAAYRAADEYTQELLIWIWVEAYQTAYQDGFKAAHKAAMEIMVGV